MDLYPNKKKKTYQFACSFFSLSSLHYTQPPSCEDSKKAGACKPRRGPSLGEDSASTLILNFSATRTGKNIFLSYLVYFILL